MDERKRREIGSEFWDIPQSDAPKSLFPSQTQWCLAGRAALNGIIKDICTKHRVATAAVPAWCCDSMIVPFLENGLKVSFYAVSPERSGGLKRELHTACDVVLDMTYFGYSAPPLAVPPQTIVIRDVTHSLFTDGKEAFAGAPYSFGSLRKWAGFFTGGFAYCRDGAFANEWFPVGGEAYIACRKNAMRQKQAYMTGSVDDKAYLAVYEQAEDMLETMPPYAATAEDVAAANRLDTAMIGRSRRRNAQILLDVVSDMALFRTIGTQDVPMFVPILVPDGKRDALRRFLIEREIYCPVHWPLSAVHGDVKDSLPLYRDSLSLVCDQRYTEQDMYRVCEAVKDFFKE